MLLLPAWMHFLNGVNPTPFGRCHLVWPAAPRFDLARFGYEVFRSCPRQSDLLIVAGTLTWKMTPPLIRLYEEMPEPKYVIAMGNCNIGGGPFADSYSVVTGLDKIMPVDVYLPGCPPRPEALIDAMLKLKKLIRHPELGRDAADAKALSRANLELMTRPVCNVEERAE